jgi:predicted nucleotidyltransferase
MIAEKVLGSKSKIYILRIFHNHPTREFCLEDLRKILKRSTGTIHPPLSELADLGILNARRAGRTTLYTLNRSNPFVISVRKVFRTEKDFMRRAAEEFVRKISKDGIISVILFGSVARGESVTGSDIDLLVIYSKNRKIVEENVSSTAEDYSKKGVYISPVYYSRREIADMARKYNSFVIRVQDEGRVLHGIPIGRILHGKERKQN